MNPNLLYIIAALSAVNAVPTVPTLWEELAQMTIADEQQRDQHQQHHSQQSSAWIASEYLKNALPESASEFLPIFADKQQQQQQQQTDQQRDTQQQDQQSSPQSFPWSASEYLKNALRNSTGLVTIDEGFSAGFPEDFEDLVLMNDLDVVKRLEKLGLSRAADIIDIVVGSMNFFDMFDAFTIIAPTDAALDAFDKTLDEMKLRNTKRMPRRVLYKIMTSWVLPKRVQKADMINELTIRSELGSKVRFNQYKEKRTVNGVEMTKFDDTCGERGVVHVTNKVMYPLPLGSILETLAEVPQFSTFVALVAHADMMQEVEANALTILVPTNDAFKSIADQIRVLARDKTKTRQLIRQHMITGTWYSAGISDGKRLQTTNQNKIGFKIDNDRIFVNDLSSDIKSEVIYRDMPAYNGVFHVIDQVIFRPSPTYLTWY